MGRVAKVGPTPPTLPIVQDTGYYLASLTQMTATWNASDPESGLSTAEYSIGTRAGLADIRSWTDIPTNEQINANGLNLQDGQKYFINVRVKNGAGLWSAVGSSDGIIAINPLADSDNDGYTNQVEVAAKSNPFNSHSIPGVSVLNLYKGFNLVSFPAETLYYEDMFNLIENIGGNNVISSIQILDPTTQTFNEVKYDASGNLVGENIDLTQGRDITGLIIYAKADANITFTSVNCSPWDLLPGINLVGTACANAGTTAFTLLQAIGNETVISSIQRYNKQTGKFETAGYSNGNPTGVDFSIVPSEGIFVYMKQGVSGFRP